MKKNVGKKKKNIGTYSKFRLFGTLFNQGSRLIEIIYKDNMTFASENWDSHFIGINRARTDESLTGIYYTIQFKEGG